MPRLLFELLARPKPASLPGASRKGTLARAGRRLYLELLEARNLLAVLHPNYVILSQGGLQPFGSTGATGTTPTQIRHAYGFDKVSFNGGKVAADGSGTTIAIVDAYDNPTIADDLVSFDQEFNLPAANFTKVNQTGGSTPPAADNGWAGEIALDVEWAHAIAPGAKILLVEANSATDADLFTAVAYAARQPGVVAVSMSFGGGEFSGQKAYDNTFRTPVGHAGVTFIASSGDSGAPASFPAASPNVLAVGGTSLRLTAGGTIINESAWSGSGGGLSTVERLPVYQKLLVTQTKIDRANPDVSYDSDPNTGFPIFDTTNNPPGAPWTQIGGTSDASPQWAALIAIADQGRVQAGFTPLDGPSQTLPKLYSLPAADFYDITSGSSLGFPRESAGPGFDLATGRGSPLADKVIADLISPSGSGNAASQFTVTAAPSATAGTPIAVTVTALDASGKKFPGYTGKVHFTSTDASAVLPPDYTFLAGDNGVHVFTITLKTSGTEGVTVADTSVAPFSGTTSVIVNPAAAVRLGFSQQPGNTPSGSVIQPAVTVVAYDNYGNVVSFDNSDMVTLTIFSGTAGATLSGQTTATVNGGVATFSNLSIDKLGTYTLQATSGSLSVGKSQTFSITVAVTGTTVEDFERPAFYIPTGFGDVFGTETAAAAHDGKLGLDLANGNDWIYRNDSAAQVKAGDTASVWVQFSGAADGRAYFGFGASPTGTLSLVAAPNTGQLIIQLNSNYNFTNLAVINQTYQANHWYRLEVDWGRSGLIVGKLFDSDGKTLVRTVMATTTAITSGGIAFRAVGSDKFFDTVTASYGVNPFGLLPNAVVVGNNGNNFSPAGSDRGSMGVGRLSELQASFLLGGFATGNNLAQTGAPGGSAFTPSDGGRTARANDLTPASSTSADHTFAAASDGSAESHRSSTDDDATVGTNDGLEALADLTGDPQ